MLITLDENHKSRNFRSEYATCKSSIFRFVFNTRTRYPLTNKQKVVDLNE